MIPYENATEAVKRQICDEYGQKKCFDTKKGEIDRLIPLEIGGEDSIDNLWWLPKPDYNVKLRKVNAEAKSMICSGEIDLKTAQSMIQHNWVVCMWVIEGMKKCHKCTVTVAPNIKVPAK